MIIFFKVVESYSLLVKVHQILVLLCSDINSVSSFVEKSCLVLYKNLLYQEGIKLYYDKQLKIRSARSPLY